MIKYPTLTTHHSQLTTMFDIGITELLLIVVATIVFVGPKDLPVVVRAVARFMRDLRAFYVGAKHQAMKLAEEAGIHDLHQEMTTIIDLEGKPQQAYDVRELASLRMSSARDAGAPLPAGEAGFLNERSEFRNPGEGAVEQALASRRPHPDSLSAAEEASLENPTSPAGRGAPASLLQANKSHD